MSQLFDVSKVFGRRNAESIHALCGKPSEKRQGRKSRLVVQRDGEKDRRFPAPQNVAIGRLCCKSRFALAIKNSAGYRRGFRVKM